MTPYLVHSINLVDNFPIDLIPYLGIWTALEPEKVTFGEHFPFFSTRIRPDPKVEF